MSKWTPERAARVKALKDERLAKGICIKCGRNPARPGRQTCEECAAKAHERNVKKVQSGQDRAARRAREEKRRQAGLCPHCGQRPPAEGRKWCIDCLTKARKTHQRKAQGQKSRKDEIRRLTEEKLGMPLCSQCLRPAMPGKKLCQHHYENFITKQEATKKANGTADQSGHAWRKDNRAIFGAGEPPKEADTMAETTGAAVAIEPASGEITIKGDARALAIFIKALVSGAENIQNFIEGGKENDT